MRIVPAVDIRGGLCVNLVQGDYAQETVFSEDPVDQARLWWRALKKSLPEADFGEAIVHIVDLDGAKSGRCCVLPQLRRLADMGIRYEVGGGIRAMETVEQVIGAGAQRVILGTAAHREPALLEAACARWPGQIVVGIDARNGFVALNGWLEDTESEALSFARDVAAAGAARIIYTDILSDGMLGGPNIETTGALARAVGIPVTISGGVASLDDIHNARLLSRYGVDEIIIGRALYVRQFTVAQAVAAARERL
ncbi:MAG TPA: 1-(5-phosphoribosyl)-5-((5-phosphoribosylamino)methylideneamino)imidazole-4-carboxamide isomerase [Candidatus Hydrogenedentes bacterium]|nr:1-(5-phosphoribosyl)-5-((5-phosphoribosylamino)methylideneamino)imidazole-4-carboxamide isomerase [Candidatus Hydrogenedentota bacterium]